MKVGMAVKPKTPIDDTIMDIIHKGLLDMFLVMTVEPGFGGQSFMEEPIEKVVKLRESFPELDIEVDGGVKQSNMHIPIKAGVNVLVSGTGLFGQDDPAEIISQMKSAINEATNEANHT